MKKLYLFCSTFLILGSASAQFSTPDTSICVGSCITFTDTVNGDSSFRWYFTGGTPSSDTSANPTVCYDSTGQFNVSLIVINGNKQDTFVRSNYITVNPTAVAGTISAQRDTICSGDTAKLKVIGSKGSIQWQSSATGVSFKNIPGATDSTYSKVDTFTTYYRVIAGVGDCADTSGVFLINAIPDPSATFTFATGNCVNGIITISFYNGSSDLFHYRWDFGDGDTSNLPNPIHNYNDSVFVVDVCLTVSNKSNCHYTLCQNVITTCIGGINNLAQAGNWNIYPNPFTGEFQVVGSMLQVENIEIYNVLGQMVLKRNYGGVQDNLTIDASGLANGMYFLKITTRDSEFVQPVVKE